MSSAEPPLPVPEDDALDAAASAVVDGVATPEEAALLAASPGGEARVGALRAVAAAVGQPVPAQDGATADRALAAALEAFVAGVPDDGRAGRGAQEGHAAAIDPPSRSATSGTAAGAAAGSAGGDGHRRATVTPFPVPPPHGAAPPRWLPRLSLVAAALVVLVGIGALVGFLGAKDDKAVMSSAAPDAASESATSLAPASLAAPRTNPAAGLAGPGMATSTVPPPASRDNAAAAAAAPPPVVDGGDVGRQTDLQALAQRAAAALDSTPDPATTGRTALATDVQACVNAGPTAAAAAAQPVGPLRYRAVGSFQGTPAVVLAYDRPGTPSRLLLVLARTGCTLLDETPF